jgi:hypothetical protein
MAVPAMILLHWRGEIMFGGGLAEFAQFNKLGRETIASRRVLHRAALRRIEEASQFDSSFYKLSLLAGGR